jgi:hypothetical protein
MDPHGYIESELSKKGRWFKNLFHWIALNGMYFEEIQQIAEDACCYRSYTDSVVKPDVSYLGYIDVIGSAEVSSCYIELSIWNESKDLRLYSDIQSLIDRMNEKNSKIQFELDEDRLRCIVESDRFPNEADGDYITKMIYDCFDSIESLLQAQELEVWISALAD